jgi:predicted dehydrogenase
MSTPRLRFAIVGMTSDHVWFLGDDLASLPEVEIVAGAEPYAELRARAATQWGLERTYADYRELFENETLDAILVCGDNAGKPAIVEAAAARGVHVYQDKPMGATLADAERSLRAVEQSGITLMVAYHTAFDPHYAPMKALVTGGAIGRPFLARGVSGHGGPKEFGCSKYFCEWLFDKGRNGGGTFVDEACYLVDTFLDCLGPVAEVSAFTAQIGHRDYLPPDVEDSAVALLKFRSGALGIIDSKWGQVGSAPVRLSYHGTHGSLVHSVRGTELYSTLRPAPPADWEPIDIAAIGHFYGQAKGLQGWRLPPHQSAGDSRGAVEPRYFVDALLGRHAITGPTSPRLARDTQEVIEAAYRSAATGRAVSLPLAE